MIRTAALALAILALSSCAPKNENGSAGLSASAGSAIVKAEVNPQEVSSTSSPRDGTDAAFRALETLGLTVFPEPQPIPAIELESLDGKEAAVSDLKGKYVFLNFWATWCPPCREEMPSIQRMNDQLSGPDFAVYAVSVGETRSTVESFLKKTPYSFPMVLDPKGQISAVFAGRGIPTTYILDRNGRAIAGIVGARPWDTEEVLNVFRTLMALEDK